MRRYDIAVEKFAEAAKVAAKVNMMNPSPEHSTKANPNPNTNPITLYNPNPITLGPNPVTLTLSP